MLYFTSTVQRVHVLSLVLFCKETCSYARTYSYTDVSILSSSVITKYYTVLYVLIVYGVYSYYQLSCSTGTSGSWLFSKLMRIARLAANWCATASISAPASALRSTRELAAAVLVHLDLPLVTHSLSLTLDSLHIHAVKA